MPPFKYLSVQPLVDKVAAGDIQAREELLNQLLAYVKTRLGRITRQETRLHGDLDALVSHIAEHLVDLVYAVSQGKQIDNIVKYVSATLYIWCLRYLDTLLSFGKSRMKHLTGIVQERHPLDTIYCVEVDADLLDTLDAIAYTDREREFIRLRSMGYKSYEIAEMLGISQVVVSNIRQTLIRRYQDEAR
jgi:DNA-directed RNA polymerase specialized sigma subunit